MRFVPDLPPLPLVTDEEEPHPLRAVRPVRPVEARTRVPLVVQRFGQKTRARESGHRAAFVSQEKRKDKDRREKCRRLQQGQAFLDTRVGMERRTQKRRDDDIITTLDAEG